ncbi:MAG: GlsB/YeaQ/YmgE family stress response membrane protein [Candidatus Dormibacteraceae bacterium]
MTLLATPILAQTISIQLDLHTIIVWVIVGLVAGFLASRVMLGHSLGFLADIVVGIIGAVVGGFLADYFGVHVTIVGHPIISQIIIAFLGALILLLLLRLVGLGRGTKRRRAI